VVVVDIDKVAQLLADVRRCDREAAAILATPLSSGCVEVLLPCGHMIQVETSTIARALDQRRVSLLARREELAAAIRAA
jgi:hypothetical protein